MTMTRTNAPELEGLLTIIASEHGVSVDELRSPRRHRPLPQARAEFCKRAWALNHHSAPQIGSLINRDHTSVLYFLGRLSNKRRKDE